MRKKCALALALVAATATTVAQDRFPETAVADIRAADTDTAQLKAIKRLRAGSEVVKKGDNTPLRATAVRQEGLRVGSQAGLSARYGIITQYMDANENRLNVLFNFNPFVDGRLLMPAVAKVQDTFKLDENGNATTIRNSFTISEEARIISNPPTWRDYLYQSFEPPEDSHYSVLPANPREVRIWEDAVEHGWKAGVTMADEIFSDGLAELTKALEERYRYQLLLSQGVVSPPVLGVDRKTITYNGRTLNVGETIYTVEQPVNYTATPNWRPIWSK